MSRNEDHVAALRSLLGLYDRAGMPEERAALDYAIAAVEGKGDWIPVTAALPGFGQWINGKNDEGQSWREQYDPNEPLGRMVAWRPALKVLPNREMESEALS